MAQIKSRTRNSLPKDKVFLAGYDQGYLDVANAVLTFFEQKFLSDGDRPEAGTEEYKKFLEHIGEISRFLKDERKKAEERVRQAK